MESREAAHFLLFGGFHSFLFWVGLVLLGCVIPAVTLFRKDVGISGIVCTSILVISDVFCGCWLRALPGLMFPPELFPGWEIVPESAVMPEGIIGYSVSFAELLQALGIFSLSGLLFLCGMKFLRIVPGEARMPE